MVVFSMPSSAASMYVVRKFVLALSLPLDPSNFQLVFTFPFNVLLVMSVILIVGIVRIFTRKPTRNNHSMVDVENQPVQEGEEEVSILALGASLNSPMQTFEEDMPRSFNSSKEGVVELYNWFYKFAQVKINGVRDNMTPRELMKVVSGGISSQGVLPLEYLITCFEIANYSKKKLTKEMQSKCLSSVEVLKNLIEGADSRTSDYIKESNEFSSELVTHNLQVHEA
jgi:hypothetical protein